MNNKIITTFVKDMAIIIFVMFPLLASAQIEPLCPNCKKTISKCPYKGKHPKVVVCSTCKKLVSKCPFKGKHPHQELIEKKIVVDGMTYNIKGKEATLIKGKIAESIMIPQYVSESGRRYPVVAIYKAFFEKGFGDSLKSIKSISIPYGVKSISYRAFQGCHSINSLYIPASVEIIENEPFYDCYGLKTIIVDSRNTHFDSREDCNAIIDKRKSELIVGCRNTKIPKGIKKLGDSAFSGCSELSSISIPESVLEIGRQTFHSCKKLKVVSLPSSTQKIGVYAFQNSGLETLKIPVGVDIPSDAVPKTANVIKF